MSLRAFMTATASTQRKGAMTGAVTGNMADNLASVSITPPMISSNNGDHIIHAAQGLSDSAVQIWRAYTESHSHTDSGATVNQVPDIDIGDKLTCNGVTYYVFWVETQPATSAFAATLMIYMYVDKKKT